MDDLPSRKPVLVVESLLREGCKYCNAVHNRAGVTLSRVLAWLHDRAISLLDGSSCSIPIAMFL